MEATLHIANELYKARRGAPPPPAAREISALRGSRAAFQIVLDAGGKKCRLATGCGNCLPPEMTRPLYRVKVASVFSAALFPERYLADEQGILRADILSSAPYCDYDGDLPPALYCELDVPLGATPGAYDVTVSLYASLGAHGERQIAEASLRLTVQRGALPRPADYTLQLDLWQHNSNLARYYGVEPWSDAHFAKIEPVVKALADLGQKSVTVVASDCPWRGWGCYLLRSTPATLYEFSPVKIVKTRDGAFAYDFSALIRYVRLCERYGIAGDVTVYGLLGIWRMPLFSGEEPDLPEKALVRYLDEADGAYRYLSGEDEYRKYLSALFHCFKSEGLLPRVRIGADEPKDMEAFRRSVELIRSVEPAARFKIAADSPAVLESLAGSGCDLAASFPCACGKRDLLAAGRGKDFSRVLWYVCNIPDRPNTVLAGELGECIVLGALMHRFGSDGFLRWAFTCWTDRPTEDIRFNDTSLPAGDLALIYPAANGGVDLSLRYKALKRGIELYEMLARLTGERLAQAEEALGRIVKSRDLSHCMKTDRQTDESLFCFSSDTCLAVYEEVAACYSKETEVL